MFHTEAWSDPIYMRNTAKGLISPAVFFCCAMARANLMDNIIIRFDSTPLNAGWGPNFPYPI